VAEPVAGVFVEIIVDAVEVIIVICIEETRDRVMETGSQLHRKRNHHKGHMVTIVKIKVGQDIIIRIKEIVSTQTQDMYATIVGKQAIFGKTVQNGEIRIPGGEGIK
jgi:hypothetical protein